MREKTARAQQLAVHNNYTQRFSSWLCTIIIHNVSAAGCAQQLYTTFQELAVHNNYTQRFSSWLCTTIIHNVSAAGCAQ
jgi:hypothetical protein